MQQFTRKNEEFIIFEAHEFWAKFPYEDIKTESQGLFRHTYTNLGEFHFIKPIADDDHELIKGKWVCFKRGKWIVEHRKYIDSKYWILPDWFQWLLDNVEKNGADKKQSEIKDIFAKLEQAIGLEYNRGPMIFGKY